MKKVCTLIVLLTVVSLASAQVKLSYYLPKDVSYDPEITKPKDFNGYEVGEMHITHDKLYYYMQELARISDRAVWEEYGRSYEHRPLGHLIISSPENILRLEEIREQHLKLSEPGVSAGIDVSDMPVIVRLGYGVHGNESSAHNAAQLVAYHLVAGNSNWIRDLLEHSVILIDPSLNPDGQTRHSGWVNINRSKNPVSDPSARGFSEWWPGGRTNHYWFDLNRDWLMVQHPESQGRVAAFHAWKPNINTDHHEMGASSTFFFQPGVPERNNPNVPNANYELTKEVATYHAKYLDNIGSYYYSEEGFDDFYFGKGSSYPDVHASVGILFEQAGYRGFERETSRGLKTFPFAIKNQFMVSLSSLDAGLHMRKKLLEHQKNFYLEAMNQAMSDPVKAWIFGDDKDLQRNARMVEMLQRHQIEVYGLKKQVEIDGISYYPGKAFIVPGRQKEYRFVKSLFETVTRFNDHVFYDISTWTMPLAFNLPYKDIRSVKELESLKGEKLNDIPWPEGKLLAERDAYAYLMSWENYYSPAVLYNLQKQGIRTLVATAPFTAVVDGKEKEFTYGTIMIPAYGQDQTNRDELYGTLDYLTKNTGITIEGVQTGLTEKGIDMGSNSFVPLDKPNVLILTDDGTSSSDAGENWHLLDQHFGMDVTLGNTNRFSRFDLDRYNVILASGSPSIGENGITALREWVRNGGTLIALKSANSWLSRNTFLNLEYKEPPESEEKLDYAWANQRSNRSIHSIPGSIFKAEIDITHPLCYGYYRKELPVFIRGGMGVLPGNDPYNNPVVLSKNPLISGYCSDRNKERLAETAFATVHGYGSGSIVSFYGESNFRAIWYGTARMMTNAVFFGPNLF